MSVRHGNQPPASMRCSDHTTRNQTHPAHRYPIGMTHPTIYRHIALLLLALTTIASAGIAQNTPGTAGEGGSQPEDDEAREIYEELDRRLGAVTYETATLNMRIVDPRGRVRERNLDTWSYNEGDVRQSLVKFNAPADVRGTGLLTLSEGDTEVQRFYLPALNRIQTIAGSGRSDRFMGSDFTYDDLGSQDPDAFSFTTLSHDRQAGRITVRGERNTEAAYAWADFMIDTERYVLLKATYFAEDGTALRELTADDITELREGIWRAGKLTMRDLIEERYTELVWTSRTIDEPINPMVFTERYLQR